MAVVRSGLTARSMLSSFLMSERLLLYSGSRMRAMAYCAPKCLAIRQQTMFVSSLAVVAMMMSAWRASASMSVGMFAPLPLMHSTSSVSMLLPSASPLLSMMTTSCPSPERVSARV